MGPNHAYAIFTPAPLACLMIMPAGVAAAQAPRPRNPAVYTSYRIDFTCLEPRLLVLCSLEQPALLCERSPDLKAS